MYEICPKRPKTVVKCLLQVKVFSSHCPPLLRTGFSWIKYDNMPLVSMPKLLSRVPEYQWGIIIPIYEFQCVHFFFSQIIVNYVFKNVYEIEYNNNALHCLSLLSAVSLDFYFTILKCIRRSYDICAGPVRGSKELS